MAKEKNFENRIKKFLKDNRIYYIKYWGGGDFTKAGVPDLIACVGGYFVAIEVKSDTGKPSDLQLVNLNQIESSYGYAILLYPEDFKLFQKMMIALHNNEMQAVQGYYQHFFKMWYEVGVERGVID